MLPNNALVSHKAGGERAQRHRSLFCVVQRTIDGRGRVILMTTRKPVE
jgi:hypothetical protein